MKERHEEVARKRRKGRHRLLALGAKRVKFDQKSDTIDENDENSNEPVKFILHARSIQFHLHGNVALKSKEGEPQA